MFVSGNSVAHGLHRPGSTGFHMDHRNYELIKIFESADTYELNVGNLKENCHISSEVLAGVMVAGVAMRRLQLVQCMSPYLFIFSLGDLM